MNIHVPTGSIMWGNTPGTNTNMPWRMRTLIQLWRVTNGQKTELLTVRFSANGGVHGANNHPLGSAMDLPIGRYCFVIYNLSENQVPINQLIFRGDSKNTSTIWGTAKDINGYACYNKVEAGEKGEIIFDVENYDNNGYYHLDCNAWFVSPGLEQSFTSTATDTITDYGINPLRITLQDGVIYFYNYIRQNPNVIYLGNSQYFEGSTILNPFYIAITTATTSGTASGTASVGINVNGVINPTTESPKKRNFLLYGSIALLAILTIKRNENSN